MAKVSKKYKANKDQKKYKDKFHQAGHNITSNNNGFRYFKTNTIPDTK